MRVSDYNQVVTESVRKQADAAKAKVYEWGNDRVQGPHQGQYR